MKPIVHVYVNVIIRGTRTIDKVPESVREDVKTVLIARGYPELASGDD